MNPRKLLSCCLLMTCCVTTVQANDWSLCRYQPESLEYPFPRDDQTRFFADSAFIDRDGISRLEGNVALYDQGRMLRADRITYEESRSFLETEGNVRFQTDTGLFFESPGGFLHLDTETGRFEHARYRFDPRHARGEAKALEPRGHNTLYLQEATYTTCDPGRDHWLLSARHVQLNQDSGQGTARGVLLRFQGVPLFYTPWITFPIDDRRKSGLLPPSFGTSDNTGADLLIPFYLNLAPHRDATLGLRLMDSRGAMLMSEFRYLNPSNRGRIQLDYLPNDTSYGEDRTLVAWDHHWRISPRLHFHTTGSDVSDDRYFRDLGDSLDDTSITHLERRADLVYAGQGWTLLGRVQDFQIVDETLSSTSRPYKRLPQLLYQGRWPWQAGGFDYRLRAEWVAFERDDSVTARRTDLMPEISRPMHGAAWFVTPSLKYRVTHYDLDDQPADVDSNLTRALPIASLDAGLFLERPLESGNIQTLEPRLYYLYTPRRDQDDIPLFDTAQFDFSFDQLFRDHRFSGPDRVADADQLTTGLTTRIIDGRSGEERLRVSLGQIHYFDDRRVTLREEGRAETADSSSMVAEMAARLGDRWRTRAGAQWDPRREQMERSSALLQYRVDGRRVINLSHRYREDLLEQADLSFAWPLSRHWDVVGRWAYSLEDNRDLEVLAGLEYKSCCWAFRLVSRRYLNDGARDEYNDGIYFQLILKGLGSLGTGLGDLLSEGVLGYETDY
ncbi:LPS-assembly protein LptD [Ectothiorhodospira lacustris]|uniref:LPS-assembly protein LptD n=1 Tax=Ectothiorhodospira lacustris TaxID=2899127 RepID=UPI001EE83BFE|nr:LPS assembly protein LptD [Ectothiorhodospira lacustris]MCG5499937.1 LPS assembly protein LptD [Ectothiorhodospira lacustris]MCG5508856.1 LPS assembly protein LptD [Ectothiorhodospira lacustris]MCG5520647.1 LPS assembly protein LptD [Ectothiorhodospira lacustris]